MRRTLCLIAVASTLACQDATTHPLARRQLPRAATPTFSPPATTYTAAQSVTIASETPDAVVHCTRDGTPPTSASPVCADAIAVASTTTLRAVATADGYSESDVATGTFTIDPAATPAAAPTFSPDWAVTYSPSVSVTVSSTTAGATIHCTRDGSPATAGSPTCTSPLSIATTTTLRAVATAPAHTVSPESQATYRIQGTLPQAARPTFSPAAGTYPTPQSVHVASATGGATLRCTTDGTPATAASPACPDPVPITSSTTLRAVATASGYVPSAETTGTYTLRAATPTFSPPGGPYTTSQNVHVSTTTPGATLRCTTNGADPTAASPVCADPIAVASTAGTTTIKAIATLPGWSSSLVGSARYTFGTPGGTQVAGGTLSTNTTWGAAGSPYYVNGNILVAQGAKLTVEAGTEVVFTGHYALDVCGQLDARGTAPTQRDILFTAANHVTGWAGIRIHGDNYSGNDASGPRGSPTLDQYLENSVLEYANKSTGSGPLGGNYANGRGGALWAYEQRRLHLNGNLFRFCKSGASVTGDFGDNTGAVTIFYNHSATEDVFADNDFEDNWSYGPGGAFSVYHSSVNANIAGMGIRLLRGSFKRNVAVNNPYTYYPFYLPPGTSTPSIGGALVSYDSDIVLENVTLGTGADANTQADYAWAHAALHSFTILTTP